MQVKTPLTLAAGAALALMLQYVAPSLGTTPEALVGASGIVAPAGGPVTVTLPIPDQDAGETVRVNAPGYTAELVRSETLPGYVDVVLTPDVPEAGGDLGSLLQVGG